MNFQQAKDEVLKWLVPLLLGGIFYEVNDLSKAMVSQQAKVAFAEFRLDKHAAKNDEQDKIINANSSDIKVLNARCKL